MAEKEIREKRYQGVDPKGYVLVSEETLEKLKDFDVWKKWKNNEITLQELETYENF
jgi:hypothetical protein